MNDVPSDMVDVMVYRGAFVGGSYNDGKVRVSSSSRPAWGLSVWMLEEGGRDGMGSTAAGEMGVPGSGLETRNLLFFLSFFSFFLFLDFFDCKGYSCRLPGDVGADLSYRLTSVRCVRGETIGEAAACEKSIECGGPGACS